MIGLEFLPSVGLAAADVDELLALVAALNAETEVPGAVGRVPDGRPQDEFDELLGGALERIGARWPRCRPDAWLETYRAAARVHATMPQALTHGELAAQQVGRTGAGRLVMVDLATLGLRPRFADLAGLLPGLARLTGRDERSVLTTYLRHLRAAGGPDRTAEQVASELRIARFVHELEALPWRLDHDLGAADHLDAIATDHPAVRALVGR